MKQSFCASVFEAVFGFRLYNMMDLGPLVLIACFVVSMRVSSSPTICHR